MDPITQQIALASAGGKKDPLYVDDVFSTFLYEGNNTTGRNIPNGIDLAGEGGLVWVKKRSASEDHVLLDTERGANNFVTITNNAAVTSGGPITAFRSDGFTVDNNGYVNSSSTDYVSWTFRKAPGFFDVVTYTGNGTLRTIPHNLGSVPGMIIIKESTGIGYWHVYHRSLGNDKWLRLDSMNSQSGTTAWNDTTPTSTHFTINSDADVNDTGETFVAYVFAHDDAKFGTDSDESIIKFGSYTGNNGSQKIDVGFEPQFFMVKNTSSSDNWAMVDIMRGAADNDSNQPFLLANDNHLEYSPLRAYVTSNGIGYTNESSSLINSSGHTFIYMAIRRPHKPPEAGTEVFAIDGGNSSSTIPAFDSGFPVDFAFRLSAYASSGNNPRTHSRLQGARELYTPLSAAESADSATVFDSMTGMSTGFTSNDIAWMFKRAPGFMDVVAYNGSTTFTQNVSHNLGVVPEMMIIKNRDGAYSSWVTYHTAMGATKFIRLNSSGDPSSSGSLAWDDTAPTASVFTVGNNGWDGTNYNGNRFIAYLFATLPGISFVGNYSGTGNDINVDCGFTSGARFVLIKRYDNGSAGDWYLFDSYRGIWSGADAYIQLNTTNGQTIPGSSYIDPLTSGFQITSSAPAALNASGGTYLFLAIA